MVRLSTRTLGDVLLLPNSIKNETFPNYFEPLGEELFEDVRFADFKSYDGNRYGIATGASTTGIVYNKEAFKKAGITDIPTKLDDIRYAPISPDWFVGISKFSANKELALAWIDYFVHDSGYVDDSGFLPVVNSKKPTLPQFKQFLSFGSEFVEKSVPSDELLEIAGAANMTFWSGGFIQEWIAAPSLKEVFDQYNKRWKEARTISKS